MVRMLRMMGLTIPVPLALGYCWTQAIIQAELGGGQQTLNSIGLMLILVVLPLTLMFSVCYLLPILHAVGNAITLTYLYAALATTFIQTLGCWWGYAVLSQIGSTPSGALAGGGLIGVVALCLQFLLYPRPVDTVPPSV